MNRLAIIFLALATTAAAQNCVGTSVDMGFPFVFTAGLLETGDVITAEHLRGCAGSSVYLGGPNAAVPVHVEIRLPVGGLYDQRRLRPGRPFSIHVTRGAQRWTLWSRQRSVFHVPGGQQPFMELPPPITLVDEGGEAYSPEPARGYGYLLQVPRTTRLAIPAPPVFVFDRGLGEWVATELGSLGPGVHIIRIGL